MPNQRTEKPFRLAELANTEAACADLARLSAAAKADCNSCLAVSEAALLPEKDAEKGAHRILNIFGLALKVPISKARLKLHGEELVIPFLKPSDFLKKLLESHADVIWAGGDPQQRCLSFWKAYHASHPGHQVFQQFSLDQLAYVVPLLLHGDEGSGSKKQPIAIVSWQTPWGSATEKSVRVTNEDNFLCCSLCASKCRISKCCVVPDSARVETKEEMDLGDLDYKELQSQFPTTAGNSYLTRHLMFVLPTHHLKKGPEVLDTLLASCAADLDQVFTEGIMVGSCRFFGALIACKGDSKWFAQIARLQRSYADLGEISSRPICAECLAGDECFPFEDTTDSAAWVSTLYESVPWDPHRPGELEVVPFDDREPARKYKRDLLHVVKIGIGRDIVGGTLTMLARFFRHFDAPGDSQAFEQRLKRAHARFALFCLAEGHCPHLRGFTMASMHMSRIDSYAFSNSKGSDTMRLVAWLRLECGLAFQKNQDHQHKDLLRAAEQVCASTTGLFRICYSHGLFLPRPCMANLRDEVLRASWMTTIIRLRLEFRDFEGFNYII